MNRQAIVSLVIIWLAAAAAGAGTMAYFSDTETSEDNTVGLGTLDLTIDGKNGAATTTIAVDGIRPGQSGQNHSTLSNRGSADGVVDIELGPGENLEGVSPASEPDSLGSGELGSRLWIALYLSDDSTLEPATDTRIAEGTFDEINDTDYDVDHPLTEGETNYLLVTGSVPERVGNDLQGDVVTLAVTAELHQPGADPDDTVEEPA